MIVSPKAAEAAGKDFGLHPVCTGPFKFVERVAQDRIVLERFADYWNEDAIHFDRVIYQPMRTARSGWPTCRPAPSTLRNTSCRPTSPR